MSNNFFQFCLQAGSSFVICLILLKYQREIMENNLKQMSQDRKEEREYLLSEITNVNKLAQEDRKKFDKERQEFRADRERVMDNFLTKLGDISSNIVEMQHEITDVKDTVSDLKQDVVEIKSKKDKVD